jgi:uncharacterized protein (DUF1499 family)
MKIISPHFSFTGLALLFSLAGCSGVPPAHLGVKEGKLMPCPPLPNCVSSQSPDKEHAVDPFTATKAKAESMADLRRIVLRMKRSHIASAEDTYLRVEFTSAIWRFTDDVEFYFDEAAGVIHVRSASRIGQFDLGVNRKRVEEIRTRWNALVK